MDAAKKIGELIETLFVKNCINDSGFETENWTDDWTSYSQVNRQSDYKYEGEYALVVEAGCPTGYIEKEWNPTVKLKNIELMGFTLGTENSGKLILTITYDDDSTYEDTKIFTYNEWQYYLYSNLNIGKSVKKIQLATYTGSPRAAVYIDNIKVNLGVSIVKYDEFDPKDPQLQILIENFPIRSTWIIEGVYRIDHQVRITLYKKLIRYEPSNVETYRIEWYDMKSDIDEILIKYKFAVEGINNIITGTWDDRDSIAVGRGIKTTEEPIIWRSEQTITCIYYSEETLVNE